MVRVINQNHLYSKRRFGGIGSRKKNRTSINSISSGGGYGGGATCCNGRWVLSNRRPLVIWIGCCSLCFFAVWSLHTSTRTIPSSSSSTNPSLPTNRKRSTISTSSTRRQVMFPENPKRLSDSSMNHKYLPQNSTSTDLATTPIVVAYVVSITGCGKDPTTEGGAVLRHSIHQVSSRSISSSSNSPRSKYDYQMVAIYHPSAESCARPLETLGYHLLQRSVFVNVSDIQGEFIRERIVSNGCCGEKELIKLEAYTLTDYPIVVLLDLDVLVLQPMDDIFDMMLLGNEAPPSRAIMWPDRVLLNYNPTTNTGTFAGPINAFYTIDYPMVNPSCQYKPVQGGFLVTRPNLTVYEEFRDIVRKGDFRERQGWGGKVGPFHGSMTFQGLIPYYYHVLHPGQSIELSRCIYNQMADNPRTKKTVNDIVHGKCLIGTEECEDCRSRPLEDIVSMHFTLCQKPWTCNTHKDDIIQHRLCRKVTHEWYRVRSDLEASWGRSGMGTSEWQRELFFGYCNLKGPHGYQPIQRPYGYPIAHDLSLQ